MEIQQGQTHDPVELLQREWADRRQKNPLLTLRAFARFLKIPPGRLSEILSKKRKISLEMAEHISKRLGLNPALQAAFISSILKNSRRKAPTRLAPKGTDESDPEYKQLTIDAFYVISDWYHFAILNLRCRVSDNQERPSLT